MLTLMTIKSFVISCHLKFHNYLSSQHAHHHQLILIGIIRIHKKTQKTKKKPYKNIIYPCRLRNIPLHFISLFAHLFIRYLVISSLLLILNILFLVVVVVAVSFILQKLCHFVKILSKHLN